MISRMTILDKTVSSSNVMFNVKNTGYNEMYKNILCAIDISYENEIILDKTSEITIKYNAKMSILHVIENCFLSIDQQKKLKNDVMPEINKIADDYNVLKKNLHVIFGQAYISICDLSEKHKVDLVVLGSHGGSGVQAFLGSTATGVLNHAKCDVLLINLR